MAYIGSTPESQNFTSGTDYFNGTGSQTVFTLTRTVNSVNDIEAVVNNVVQQPNTAYTINGATLTFTAAPSAGTSNIYVRYLSTTLKSAALGQGSVGTTQLNPANMIYTNTNTLSADYTLPTGTNGMVVGPYTVATGSTLTIADNATFVVV